MPAPVRPDPAALARLRRNFWLLVAAAVVAIGALGAVLRRPAGPVTGVLTLVTALAAVLALTLAGRILVVSTRRRSGS